jgi:hypothetical protein
MTSNRGITDPIADPDLGKTRLSAPQTSTHFDELIILKIMLIVEKNHHNTRD